MQRGDILVLRRRIGFGPTRAAERFGVLQAGALSSFLDTVLVGPLDRAYPFYDEFPGAIPVSAAEAGTREPQVLLATQLTCALASRFEPVRVGRLDDETLSEVSQTLRVILDLP